MIFALLLDKLNNLWVLSVVQFYGTTIPDISVAKYMLFSVT